MSSSLRTIAATETYQDVQRLLYKLAHKAARRYQLPFEDMLSEAHRCFMLAFGKYDGSRGASFVTYVYFVVHHQLATSAQKESPHRNHLEVKEEICGTVDPEGSFVGDLIASLDSDARMVVELLLRPPEELSRSHGDVGVSRPHHLLSSLRAWLQSHEGWSKERTDVAVDEVRGHLRLLCQ